MSTELAAQVAAAHLGRKYPDTRFEVTVDKSAVRPKVFIAWRDAPRTLGVRSACLAATNHFTSAQRAEGWKFVFRHRISRELRLRARAEIMRDTPDFDYITETGDLNPESKYWYEPPAAMVEVGDPEGLVPVAAIDGGSYRLVELVAYELLRADGLLV